MKWLNFENFGGRKFLLSIVAMVLTSLMDNLDAQTKAYIIAAVSGSYSVGQGVADGLSKGQTSSKS